MVDVMAVDSMIQDELQRVALGAASRAGVGIRLARSTDEIRQVSELLAAVWEIGRAHV